jgi:hypothetical protein
MSFTKVELSGLNQNSGPLAGFRNVLINANFDIWQRGDSQSGSGYGSADRWSINAAGTFTFSKQSFTLGQTEVPNEPQFYARLQCTVAPTSGNLNLRQRIENVRTFAGQQVTLSFWARADSVKTIWVGHFRVYGTGGSPSITEDVAGQYITLSTTWTKYTITSNIPSIIGKTIGTNNNDNLTVHFIVSNAATGENWSSVPAQTITFDVAQVQLEQGPVATPFERRPIGTELALCQRYFEVVKVTGGAPIGYGAGQCISATAAYFQVSTFTPKRAIPTATLSAGNTFAVVNSVGGLVAGTGASILNYGENHATIQITVAGGLTAGNSTTLYSNGAGVTGTVQISAEL